MYENKMKNTIEWKDIFPATQHRSEYKLKHSLIYAPPTVEIEIIESGIILILLSQYLSIVE